MSRNVMQKLPQYLLLRGLVRENGLDVEGTRAENYNKYWFTRCECSNVSNLDQHPAMERYFRSINRSSERLQGKG